jgi:hypothetical protein
MCGFVSIILEYCGECHMWFNGFLHTFVRVSNWELLVEWWDRCGSAKESDANGLLLAIVFLLL